MPITRYLLLCLVLILGNSMTVTTLGDSDIQSLKRTSQAFNRVAKIGKLSVVSISTTQTVRSRSGFMNDPFFQHFYGYSGSPQQREGLGSGVIVSKYGHVLTNHHVVERADVIDIRLSDGREFQATVIGSDKKTDLALLKINGDRLPVMALGDSNNLTVGDWAIAIGNPFGLQGTVTVGIISATGRAGVVDAENYADFIQTDAAINPGNSGGALLNIEGRLIGINTAIFSRSGGDMGIGFAIPVNMAKRVMEDLLQYGTVKRGKLGVTIQPITDDILQKYRLSTREGAFVLDVQPHSVADKAGIKPNDVIVSLAGKKVSDYLSLRSRISELKLNSDSYCEVIRHGKRKTLSFVLTPEKSAPVKRVVASKFGLSVTELTASLRREYSIPDTVDGVMITKVKKRSMADRFRLSPGQVIVTINDRAILSKKAYHKALARKQALMMTIFESGYEFSIVIPTRK